MGRQELSERMKRIIEIDDSEFMRKKQAKIAGIRKLEKTYEATILQRARQRKRKIEASHDLKQSRIGRRVRARRWSGVG